jgi:serine protease AprX
VAVALLLFAGAYLFSPVAQPVRQAVINATVSQYISDHPGQNLPVLVQTGGDPAAVEQDVSRSGGQVDSQFRSLGGFGATVSPKIADQLNRDPRVQRVSINAPVKWEGSVDYSSLLNRYDGISRVPGLAWDGKSLDGTGQQIAVIDTGVWPHDDLLQSNPKVPGNQGNRLISLYTNPKATDALDHYGHGTHVAGIIAGNGYNSSGQYIGIAPNAMIVSVKVSDNLGSANEGDVIAGMEWVYQANRHGMQIRVVNLSVSSTLAQSYHQSPLDAMVEKLWFTGVVVVTAAGNGTDSVLYAPGNDPFAITVGSIDDNYQTSPAGSPMASWSRWGTTQDGIAKPDVVADGSHVVSLLAPGSVLSAGHLGNVVGTNYFKMGGTSMAAPQVAGMVALTLQANPNQNNNQVKRRIRSATVPFGNVAYTPRLGTTGGLVDATAIARVDDGIDDNAGRFISQVLNPNTGAILAGGAVWRDADWISAAWVNTSWTNTSWTNTSWTNTSWTGLGTAAPTLMSPVWSASSWANTSWTNVNTDPSAWTNTSWTNTSWTNTSWTNTSWTNTSWTNTSWTNTSWTNTSWTNTSWTNTSWTSIQWGNTSWTNTSWTALVFD